MIRWLLCSVWGHVWETVLAEALDGYSDRWTPVLAERCERCQVWR